EVVLVSRRLVGPQESHADRRRPRRLHKEGIGARLPLAPALLQVEAHVVNISAVAGHLLTEEPRTLVQGPPPLVPQTGLGCPCAKRVEANGAGAEHEQTDA